MALPQDGVNANALAKVTTIPTGKELIFIDPTTNEGGVITLEDLTKQILQNLTSQTFALDQGTKTLPAALNELNSNVISGTLLNTKATIKYRNSVIVLLVRTNKTSSASGWIVADLYGTQMHNNGDGGNILGISVKTENAELTIEETSDTMRYYIAIVR